MAKNTLGISNALQAALMPLIALGESTTFYQAVFQGVQRTLNGQSPCAEIQYLDLTSDHFAVSGRIRDRTRWAIATYIDATQLTPTQAELRLYAAVDMLTTYFQAHNYLA